MNYASQKPAAANSASLGASAPAAQTEMASLIDRLTSLTQYSAANRNRLFNAMERLYGPRPQVAAEAPNNGPGALYETRALLDGLFAIADETRELVEAVERIV